MPAKFFNHHALRSYSVDCLCSEGRGYLYVPIGKAANTAVKRFLFRSEGVGLEGFDYFDVHADKCNPGGALGSVFRDLRGCRDIDTIFGLLRTRRLLSVVRNPYARLLSGYADKLGDRKLKPLRRQAELSVPAAVRTFGDFVGFVAEQPDEFLNLHFCSQSYLLGIGASHGVSVGHVERLPAFLEFVHRSFFPDQPPVAPESDTTKHRTGAQSQLLQQYTPRLLDLVYRRFEDDFLYFGYDRDPARLAPDADITGHRNGQGIEPWQLAGLKLGIEGSTQPPSAEFVDAALESADPYQLLYYAEAAARCGRMAQARTLLRQLAEVANPMAFAFSRRLLAALDTARVWNRPVNFLVTNIMREWIDHQPMMTDCLRFIRRSEREAGQPEAGQPVDWASGRSTMTRGGGA